MRRQRLGILPLAIALFLGLPDTAHAQMGFGIKAGLTYADLSDVEVDARAGYALGVALRFSPGSLLTIQPEAMYVVKGAEDVELSNLDVPVLLKLDFSLLVLNLYAVAGPYASFNISCDIPEVSPGVDPCDDLKDTDFGGIVGGGVRLGGARGLNLEVRYQFGVTGLDDSGATFDPKTQTFFLLVGFDF
jgi:hypothetical protein